MWNPYLTWWVKNSHCMYFSKKGQLASAEEAHLSIELHVGRAEPHEAGEERLVQVAVLLEGHVLDHGRQLVVVPNQDHPLQPAHAVLLPLQEFESLGQTALFLGFSA